MTTPDADGGLDPSVVLFAAMTRLWRRAGCPAIRRMARDIGDTSPTTVHSAIRGPNVPSWPAMKSVVEYLKGRPDDVQPLWLAVMASRSGSGSASALAGSGRTDGYRLIAGAIREGLAEIAAVIREQGNQP